MGTKSKARGRGKEFEKAIKDKADFYEAKQLLVLRKVDPPTRIIGKGLILHLPNPFLDFVGSWVEQRGRAIFLEAKESEELKLGIASSASSGVTVKQLRNLRIWHAAGAVSGVIWKNSRSIYLIPTVMIDVLTLKSGFKYIRVEDIPSVCDCTIQLKLLSAMRRLFL